MRTKTQSKHVAKLNCWNMTIQQLLRPFWKEYVISISFLSALVQVKVKVITEMQTNNKQKGSFVCVGRFLLHTDGPSQPYMKVLHVLSMWTVTINSLNSFTFFRVVVVVSFFCSMIGHLKASKISATASCVQCVCSVVTVSLRALQLSPAVTSTRCATWWLSLPWVVTLPSQRGSSDLLHYPLPDRYWMYCHLDQTSYLGYLKQLFRSEPLYSKQLRQRQTSMVDSDTKKKKKNHAAVLLSTFTTWLRLIPSECFMEQLHMF